MSAFRVGVDIGGTFTDIVLWGSDGQVLVKKVSSSVGNYAQAIIDGLATVFAEAGLDAAVIEQVRHGTTVASNAILERKGAKTGLIGSKGFRDVLEIRTLRMPRLYDLTWTKPPPLVERYLRVTVDERVNASGEIVRPCEPADAEAAVKQLLAEGVEAIAVCLINSYANPANEFVIKQAIERLAPDLPYSISAEVLPEIREYERTSTTTINAYVKPIVGAYLASLGAGLKQSGIEAEVLLMQSNGGLTPAEEAARLPMNIIESGPAGGVVGARFVAEATATGDLITFDMGGTTAKASMVEDGQYARADEFEVGGGILAGSRLLTGAGYKLKTQAIDLAEVGAGGGSLVWIDRGGALQIGPASAGAKPGPVCYDIGGEQPTVTDANLVLGYLNPEALAGGAVKLNAAKARSVFAEKVAEPLGLSLENAALGAHRVAASNMIRAIKAVSTERGRDPRRYSLFAFGGNGPMFAASMARELGMARVIVPPAPGVFSAFGLLYADVEHHYSKTYRRLLRTSDPAEIAGLWAGLEERGRTQLARDGFPTSRQSLRRSASLHYKGQTFELTVAAPDGPIDGSALRALENAFHHEHETVYGHRAGDEEPVELVTIRLVAQGLDEALPKLAATADATGAPSAQGARKAYFGTDHGWLDTAIFTRADLSTARRGPCIVEEYDATCVVPPGAVARLNAAGCIVIDLLAGLS
jgi:N-methylhydantoinase A